MPCHQPLSGADMATPLQKNSCHHNVLTLYKISIKVERNMDRDRHHIHLSIF